MEDNKKEVLWLDDPKIWRNVRLGALGVLLLIAPLVYFGIVDNFEIGNFLNYEFGGLIIFMTIMNVITISETRVWAFDDEVAYDDSENKDDSIVNLELKINENADKIRPNISKGIVVLTNYNNELQTSYDKQKTQRIIDKKKAKIDRYKIKVTYARLFKKRYISQITKLERKIEKLNKTPKRDRRFKPYRFDRLITSSDISKYKRVGDNEIKSNPKKVPLLKSIIKMPLKGFSASLGSFFMMMFFVDDKVALAKFYAWFLAIMSFTVISQYILTRYKTRKEHRHALKVTIFLQDKIINGIKEDTEQIKETEQEGENNEKDTTEHSDTTTN